MNTVLQSKLEEISLMLVMTSEKDVPGIKVIQELISDLEILCSGQQNAEKLLLACQNLKSKEVSPELFEEINSFVSQAQAFSEGDLKVDFSFAKSKDLDSLEQIDPKFLVEFLETHLLTLEDLESSLLANLVGSSDSAEFETFIKRYLHNLKGDSGSIGLKGIEKICHQLESALETVSASEIAPQLMMFKEWLTKALKAFADGIKPIPSSQEFLTGLSELLSIYTSMIAEESIANNLKSESLPKVSVLALEYELLGDKDILVEFAAEAEEHLSNLEGIILGTDEFFSKDDVDTIFRGVHSLKGGSAYFGLIEMTQCSHILENFLSEVRDGKRELDSKLTALLLTYIDLQKDVLTRAKKIRFGQDKMKTSPNSCDFLDRLDLYAQGKPVQIESAANTQNSATKQIVAKSKIADADMQQHKDSEDKLTESSAAKLNVKSFVKVETARLDHLIDSIGEMVIYSSMLIRQCRELLAGDVAVMDAAQRVEKFSRELQDVGMSMRLVPIKGLFQKMSRLVWDTSKKLGKDINFIMEGEETELDRNLIDKLADPLMHMVRNSIDHGIEFPKDREASGKVKVGTVKLSAYHSGGSIHIKIEDDGKGLDPEKLIAKAIEKDIITEGQKLSAQEAFRLIFAPGFSTAAAVTDISGRGVGMDVVRKNVESLRGRIHIDSKVGQGSVFTIELPLTLAIIDGIQIEVGTESFLIPSLSIVEFVKPAPSMISCALDLGETLEFRGKYLPIFRLSSLYGFEPKFKEPTQATLVVVQNNHEQVALMVDNILGEVSTVIKSLGSVFEEGKGIAGCAIMPKGNVALILDVGSLISLAREEYKIN